jgi:hypothetical protein
VLLHDGELGGREPTRLQQDRVWNADLADVVQISAAFEHPDILVAETDVPAERRGVRASRSQCPSVSHRAPRW